MKKSKILKSTIFISICILSCNNISAFALTRSNHSVLKAQTQKSDDIKSISKSYYKGQNTKAFEMIKKNIFKKILSNGWTSDNLESIINPVWNYETFAQYSILDNEMNIVSKSNELYYCTFSADNNKQGFIVVSYNKDDASLQRIEAYETSYLYDLNTIINNIKKESEEHKIDLLNADASRIKIIDNNKKTSVEAIYIVDAQGNDFIYYFE